MDTIRTLAGRWVFSTSCHRRFYMYFQLRTSTRTLCRRREFYWDQEAHNFVGGSTVQYAISKLMEWKREQAPKATFFLGVPRPCKFSIIWKWPWADVNVAVKFKSMSLHLVLHVICNWRCCSLSMCWIGWPKRCGSLPILGLQDSAFCCWRDVSVLATLESC